MSRIPYPDVTVILGDPRLPDLTKVGHVYSREDFEAVERMKAALAEVSGYRFAYLNDHSTLLAELIASPPQFVFNMCDTGFRNDAARELNVPAVLECLDVPYTGAPPSCMVLCYDKALVRAAAAALGLPVPVEICVDPGRLPFPAPNGFPALVKPNRADGSVGITRDAVVHDEAELERYLRRLHAEWPGRPALVQEFLSGAEYGVGLIGNPGPGFTMLPVLEVDYSGLPRGLPHILGYESKTVPDSAYWTEIKFHEARLDASAHERLAAWARALFERLGCRDYARFDFRADATGNIKLLEVNSNPAWCWDGKLNIMAGFAGYSYADLLRMILETAQQRAWAENGG